MSNLIEDEYRVIFGIPSDHRLTLTGEKSHGVNVVELEFTEHDQEGVLCARYRWWNIPFKNESGWSKVDTHGNILYNVSM